MRNETKKSGHVVGSEIAKNNENWSTTFKSHNFVKFDVRVPADKGWINEDEMPVPDEWEVQQWEDRATNIKVSIWR